VNYVLSWYQRWRTRRENEAINRLGAMFLAHPDEPHYGRQALAKPEMIS
jgi:hypothetical protein